MSYDVTILNPTSGSAMPDHYVDVDVVITLKPPGTRVVVTITNSANEEVYSGDAVDRGDNLWQADISEVEFADDYYTVTAVATGSTNEDSDTATCVTVGEPSGDCPDAARA